MDGILFKIGSIAILFILLFTGFFVFDLFPEESFDENSDDISADMLLESAMLGGNYLVNATGETGRFVYDYGASQDEEYSSYNLLRHAGTIYSMLQLYDVTKDQMLLSSAKKAIDYLLYFVKSFDNDSICIVNDEDEVKLGGNALAVVALAEYMKVTDDDIYLPVMQNLTRFIEKSQKESGEFISKRMFSTNDIIDWNSDYYPGEALLALCKLYSLDYNETWLDVAEKAAKFLISVRFIQDEDYREVHDHWLMIALNELYRYRGDLLYLNHSMNLSNGIMVLQRDGVNRESEYPDWLGSYYTPPHSTSTATRTEGLVAAYNLAYDFGEKDVATSILNAIKLGINFQLKTQLKQEDVSDLPDPNQAIGGFCYSLDSYSIRIDYVQHNICSILGLYHILENNN